MKYTTTKISETVDVQSDDSAISQSTVVDAFKNTVVKYGDRTALRFKVGDSWKSTDWRGYYDQCYDVASKFLKFGLKLGEGVAILGFNSPEWFISNMAAIIAGGVSVGVYTTNSSEICEYVIKDSNSKIVIVENDAQLQKILPFAEKLELLAIIQYDNKLNSSQQLPANVYTWTQFINEVESNNGMVELNLSIMRPNACSTLIYTSGTTGNPKGVMLSHDNIVWTSKIVSQTVGLTPNKVEKVVSYLPLSHVAAQMIDMYMPLINGGETWFASPDALKGSLANTLKDAKPTIFLGVPRVWEKMMETMIAKAKDISKFKKMVSRKAKQIGLEKNKRLEQGNHSTPFGYTVFDMLVYKKVKAALGLSNCKLFLTGAAPISREVLDYFASLDILINDIYGLSECSGPMTISFPSKFKVTSSGTKIPHTQLKLDADTNEICTKGRHIMMGYINQQEKTDEAVDCDGWLHTGDIGRFDEDGFLFITGRMKELLVTSGGENIPPVLIEDNVKAELPIVSNCMLIGDKRKFLTILITLKCSVDDSGNPTDEIDKNVLDEYRKMGTSVTRVSQAISDPLVFGTIQDGIKLANQKAVSNAQRIQKFKFLPTDFSINGGELGPTLKLKRNVVMEKYAELIEEMYVE